MSLKQLARWICCVLLPLCLPLIAHSGALMVAPERPYYDLAAYVEYLEDPHGRLGLAEVQRLHGWKPNGVYDFSRGLTASAYWLRVELRSPEQQRRFLAVDYPLLDRFEVHVLSSGRLLARYEAGDTLPFHERPILNRQFVFPLTVPGEEPVTIYIRARSSGAMQLPLALWEPTAFLEEDSYAFGLQAFYLGLMLVMAMYNFSLFLFLRDRAYLLYVIYVLTFTAFVSSDTGIGYQLLWPDWPALQGISLPFWAHVSGVAACLFALSFLDVRRRSRRLFRVLAATAAVDTGMVLAIVFLPYASVVAPALWAGAATSLILIASGIVMWRAGSTHARCFTMAWSVMLSGVVLLHLSKLGWLPRMPVTEHTAQVGAALEVFLLSLALVDRVNRERRLKDDLRASLLEQETRAREANERALQIQRQANEELERRVTMRTAELSSALSSLSVAHERLKDLSTVDGLTRLRNRRYFDEQLQTEWGRSRREKTTLAVLLIDIDHFKAVNDGYGHPVGDECLRYVSACLEEQARRPGDTAARYGGEEFAVILPATDIDGALTVAEAIRRGIADRPVQVDGLSIRLTVSIGLAVAGDARSPQEALERADRALYAAKRAGRDRCVIA